MFETDEEEEEEEEEVDAEEGELASCLRESVDKDDSNLLPNTPNPQRRRERGEKRPRKEGVKEYRRKLW